MRIGINGRVLEKPEPTGVSRYTLDLLSALCSLQSDGSAHEFVLFGKESLPEELHSFDCISTGWTTAPHSGLSAHLWEQVRLPLELRQRDIDIFHTPAGNPPLVASVPQITTIHDISPISHPEWFDPNYAKLYRLLIPAAIRRSDYVLTVSQFAAEEIIEYYEGAKGKTAFVHNGVEPRNHDVDRPFKNVSSGEFFLFVGSTNPRKNLRRSIQAYRDYRDAVPDPVKFLIAGPSVNVFSSIDIPEVPGVETLGFVSEDALTWLYQHASAFVFPALYEGFGLPIVEAMSAGTPVLTSDRGAMREVAGDSALLADPEDVGDICSSMERIHTDDELRQQLIEQGRKRASEFTWRAAAEQTMQVYERIADRHVETIR